MNNFLRKPLYISLIFLICYGGFLYLYASRNFAGNVTGFLCVGRLGHCGNVFSDKLIVRDDAGYDGQYFYFMALDPFLRNPETAQCTKVDSYRYQRFLYPLVSSIFGWRSKVLTPYAMVGVNLMALALGAFMIVKICDFYNADRLYVFFFGLSVAPVICLLRSTTELLYLLFLIIGFYNYIRNKLAYSAIALSLGVLTKEITLATAIALILHQVVVRKSLRGMAYMLIPFVAYGLMQCWIFSQFGQFSFSWTLPAMGDTRHMFLMEGLARKFVQTSESVSRLPLLLVADPALIANIFIAFAILAWSIHGIYRENHPFHWASPLYLLLTHFASSAPVEMLDLWGYGRHTSEVFLLILLLFLSERKKIYLVPLSINSILCVIKMTSLYLYQS